MEILDDRVKMKLLDVIGTSFDISTWRMLFASMNLSCPLLNMCTIVVSRQCTCTAESGQLFCFTFSASCVCGRHDLPRSCQHFRWWGGTDLHIWMRRAFIRAHCTGVPTWALIVHAFSCGDVWSILERIVNFKKMLCVISLEFVDVSWVGVKNCQKTCRTKVKTIQIPVICRDTPPLWPTFPEVGETHNLSCGRHGSWSSQMLEEKKSSKMSGLLIWTEQLESWIVWVGFW